MYTNPSGSSPDYTKVAEVMQTYQTLSSQEQDIVKNQIGIYAYPPISESIVVEQRRDVRSMMMLYVVVALIAVLFVAVVGLVFSAIAEKELSQPILTIATTILGYLAGVITPGTPATSSPPQNS